MNDEIYKGEAAFTTYGTGALSALPVEVKKSIDMNVKFYLDKLETARPLYNSIKVDSADTSHIYHKYTQTYAEATGWTERSAPESLAEGARPSPEAGGMQDATVTFTKYGSAFRITQELLQSSKPLVNNYVMRQSQQMAMRIANFVNTTLWTNMYANAGAAYSASATWAQAGDPVADVFDAKNTFKKSSGGIDADFIALHPDNYADLAKDERFLNSLFVTEKSVESGTISDKLGMKWVTDTAITKGNFVMGKSKQFGDYLEVLPYQEKVTDEGIAASVYEATLKFGDRYPLSYLLLAGNGI